MFKQKARWLIVGGVALVIVALAGSAATVAEVIPDNLERLVLDNQAPTSGPLLTLREAIAAARAAVGNDARAVFVQSAPQSVDAGSDGKDRDWLVTLASGGGREALVEIRAGAVTRVHETPSGAARSAVATGLDSPQALTIAVANGLERGQGKGPGFTFILRSTQGRPSLTVVGASGPFRASVELDPTSGKVLARSRYGFARSGGLLVSDDGGTTWVPGGLEGAVFAIHADERGIVAMREDMSGLTLWRSADAHTWSALGALPLPAGESAYALLRLSSGELLAGTSRGLLRSSDDGTNWSTDTLIGPVQYLAALGGDKVLASVSAGKTAGLFVADAKGQWSSLGAPARLITLGGGDVVAIDESKSTARVFSARAADDLAVPRHTLRLARLGSAWLAATPEGVLRSPDAGRTWSPSLIANNASLFVSRDGTVFLGGFHSPTYRSTDGAQTWTVTLANAAEVIPGVNEVFYFGAVGNRLIAVEGGKPEWQPY